MTSTDTNSPEPIEPPTRQSVVTDRIAWPKFLSRPAYPQSVDENKDLSLFRVNAISSQRPSAQNSDDVMMVTPTMLCLRMGVKCFFGRWQDIQLTREAHGVRFQLLELKPIHLRLSEPVVDALFAVQQKRVAELDGTGAMQSTYIASQKLLAVVAIMLPFLATNMFALTLFILTHFRMIDFMTYGAAFTCLFTIPITMVTLPILIMSTLKNTQAFYVDDWGLQIVCHDTCVLLCPWRIIREVTRKWHGARFSLIETLNELPPAGMLERDVVTMPFVLGQDSSNLLKFRDTLDDLRGDKHEIDIEQWWSFYEQKLIPILKDTSRVELKEPEKPFSEQTHERVNAYQNYPSSPGVIGEDAPPLY